MQTFYSTLTSFAFGAVAIVWQNMEGAKRVRRIFLSDEQISAEDRVHKDFGAARQLSCSAIANLSERMQRFLASETIEFDLSIIALDDCSAFQRKVLLAERGIPRGWVSTYGKIAVHLGVPNGARAVGNALARNPFPIVIPCHRAIRSNGELGGFQGGLNMKRALLEFEGVEFSPSGKVLLRKVFY